MRERRFRARAKITQKMTRHGLVEENRATGEEKRISNRLQDISFEKAEEPEKPALDREGRYYQRTKKNEETTSLTDTRSHRRTKEITVHLQDTHATPLTETNQNQNQTIRESREDSKPVELRGENFPQGNNNVAVKPDNKQNSGFTVSRSAPQETYLKQKKQAATRYAAPSHSPRENIRSPSGNVQPLENEKVLEQKKYQHSSKESNETSFRLEHGKSNDETPQQSFSSQSKKIQLSPSVRMARDEGKPIKKIVQRSTQYQGRFIVE